MSVKKTTTKKFKNPQWNGAVLCGVFWHVHHEIPMEWCWDVKERQEYIKDDKPLWEQSKRLALMRPVRNIPHELEQLLRKTKAEGETVWYYMITHARIIKALHDRECGCDFYRNGNNLFSEREYQDWKAKPVRRKAFKGDHNLKAVLGFGDNVKALINGIELGGDVTIPSGATVVIETARRKASPRRKVKG